MILPRVRFQNLFLNTLLINESVPLFGVQDCEVFTNNIGITSHLDEGDDRGYPTPHLVERVYWSSESDIEVC